MSASLAVQLEDDLVDEDDGSVSVQLITDTTHPFSYKVGTANKGIATITDDDVPSSTTPKDYPKRSKLYQRRC